MLKKSLVLFVAFLLTGVAAAEIIAPVNDATTGFTLQQVIDAGGIRVGDKVFDNFTVSTSRSDNAIAPEAEGITVYGISIDRGGVLPEIGLRFTGGWSAVGGQIADSVITFRVAADDPFLITDNSLWMDAYGAANGGNAQITENVFRSNPLSGFSPSIADKFVFYANRGEQNLFDHQDFTDETGANLQLPQVWVVKDIVVNGGGPQVGSAAISQFYQTFSQIPEPASLSLLVVGGIAVLARRRQRS